MKKKLLFLFIFAGLSLYAEDMAVAVNPAQKEVGKGTLKQILKGDREDWPEGGKAIILINSDDKIMEDFCRSFLGMSYAAFQEFHVRNNVKSGKPYPRKVSSEVIIALTSKSKNFIGIIPADSATDTVHSVK